MYIYILVEQIIEIVRKLKYFWNYQIIIPGRPITGLEFDLDILCTIKN